jgi:hypothetical protein
MKGRIKWLVVLLVIFILSVSCIYIFIPGQWELSETKLVKCNVSAAFRNISEDSSWKKWWPGGRNNPYSYRVTGSAYPGVGVRLRAGDRDGDHDGDRDIAGIVSVLTAGSPDSIVLLWKCPFHSGLNPFGRVQQYRKALRVRKVMAAALSSLAPYLEKGENVYGMEVQNIMLRDSTLIQLTLQTGAYPSTAEVYRSIHLLRGYISSQGAKETDHPMLNVTLNVTLGKDGQYKSTIAIPVDRELKGKGTLVPVRFVPWKVLIGEVHGGTFVAERAMGQLQLYVTDHQKTSMALAFQSLVTERDQEPDTSRWVTRVIQPVP